MKITKGIHHITAIVGEPQENVDFYAGVLGLRLIKKTVNFDDPGTYHLYFGDEQGKPGTIMTFFNWVGAYQGEIGSGQVGVTQFVVPKNSFGFWKTRLKTYEVDFTEKKRFNEEYLQFSDPHGLKLELVEREEGEKSSWSFNGVTPDFAIKGFGGATLLSAEPEQTVQLLSEMMGLQVIGEDNGWIRLKAQGPIGNIIDVNTHVVRKGQLGVGTVHHIAWRATDDQDQLDWQKLLKDQGYAVTPVQDRNYFNAIYFREHGELLFEIATDPPGFTHDEELQDLGSQLMLPPQYEPHRAKIERVLLPFQVREDKL
ncbi:ring-cleaving dioxygenase [Alkalihalobacillus trypoxylicola]|uniref:Ring-cleaving dioxygenase n=1 Tax=Alkalihalobacillus trypoxylicola TaxID=519424 RepID=A0A161Q1H2_9BACI|nr:ring-cleaving dioxygenase [Alkalihalobacillus trypoxylicola]KYG29343.1 ring-cleaving dioxygenase [Alkalihalobacillus trypoxylicola]